MVWLKSVIWDVKLTRGGTLILNLHFQLDQAGNAYDTPLQSYVFIEGRLT